MLGGIKGLLYIDAFQTLLIIFTGIVAFFIIYFALDMPLSEIWANLTTGGMVKDPGVAAGMTAEGTLFGWSAGNKLVMFDPSLDPKLPYTIVGGVIGIAFFRVAQYTTDHEFVQRQLTAKDVKKAGTSLIYSQLICLPVVVLFISLGLLLFVLYRTNPEFDALGASFFTDARDVFPQFIKNHIPMGVRGLMIVGLLAAALSSFNSAINAMASSFVSDLYLPIKKERGHAVEDNADQMTSSRKMVILMGAVLTGFAIVTAVMQQSSGLNLVDFATGIMCFAYAGMIGVFLTAIFTKRGNTKSVLASLIIGALIIIPLMFQKQIFGQTYIAWCWWCPIGGIISTIVCLLGKPKKA
jgi:Na+/proline symporter